MSHATANGKLIVFGEHAVVYGHPAVACSLSQGATATVAPADAPHCTITSPRGPLEKTEPLIRAIDALISTLDLRRDRLAIDVELTIPVGVGLGSSAAIAAAVARAAARLTSLDGAALHQRIDDAVTASESIVHDTPSGIDQTAVMGDGFFTFSSGEDPTIQPLEIPNHRWTVARVADGASTARMVESVARLVDDHPDVVEPILEQFGAISEAGRRALEAGRWRKVGALMNLNQGLLNAIGVSTPTLEAACDAARRAGAFGAKLTGAGGGGCIVAIADERRLTDVETALASRGDVYSFLLPPSNP